MSINKVILVGNLCKDPDLKTTKDGKAITSFRLATNESYTDKNGDKKKLSEFHNVVCFDSLATNVATYTQKGSQVYIEGKITYRSWEDEKGEKQYMTVINAKNIQFLDAKPKKESKEELPQYTSQDIPF